MTLRHMKIFVTVCSENSITKASQKLHIAQPAVSVAVKELEEYYNIRLFDRISRHLYLTDMGKYFLEYASRIVTLFDGLENNVRQWGQAGRLKVGASNTVGTCLMPPYVNKFKEGYPQSGIDVFIGSSDIIEQKILQNELDLALIEGNAHSPSICSETYMKDSLIIICSPSDPLCSMDKITISQFLSRPLLLREVGSGTRELFDHVMGALDYSYTPSWESTSTEALVNAVRQGLGVSILSYMMVKDDIKKGSVVRIEVEHLNFDREFHVIFHKDKFLTALARDFIKMCQNLSAD